MSGLRVERDGPFARVTLDRPNVRNAFDAELIGELRATFETLAAESPDALRGVVLAGTGPVFCAGADVDWMRSAIGLGIDENERDAATLHAMLAAVDRCPSPVIARVQGAALEDSRVRPGVAVEAHVEARFVPVERVGVLHDELPDPEEAAPRPRLVPLLRREVVPDLR